MQQRWVPGFTLVELLLVVVVLVIIATLGVFAYNGMQRSAAEKSVQSDLKQVVTEMENTRLRSGKYPQTLSNTIKSSRGTSLTLVNAGEDPFYKGGSAIQNGVIFANICEDLVAKGAGKGTNNAGEVQDYVTGCGNWNNGSMQFTGWDTRVWNTPINEQVLVDYGNNFTTSDTWNKRGHEGAVKTFYNTLVTRFKKQGGTFPITTFWDYWAAPGNGGIPRPELPTDVVITSYFCVQAQSEQFPSVMWHITEANRLTSGACSS